MKAGWQLKTLGEICEVVNGGTPKTGVSEYWGNEHLWITPAEMGKRLSPYADDTARKITSQGLRDSSARLLPPYSVILSSRAPIGHLVINTKLMATNQGCKGLVPSESLTYKYLFYFLQENVDFLNDLGSGATFKELSGGKLKEVKIPLAPLTEQQRIVAILDQAFEGVAKARANAEQNLQNARTLFESHLQSVFTQRGEGWVVTTIGAVCDKVEYGTSAKSKEHGKIPVLRMGNIQNRRFDWDKLVYTDDDNEIEKYLLKHNDVLFNRTNSPELVGKAAIYKSELPAIFAGYLIRIHRKEDLINADYLNYFLNSQIAMDYGKTVAISSVNQANINGKKLKGYPIPVPPLSEQEAIVMKMDALKIETQRLEALYQRKIKLLDELKKSLLQQAFAGTL